MPLPARMQVLMVCAGTPIAVKDAQRRVWAVTVNYLGEQSGAPTPEQVFGGPVGVKPDGSVYKKVKYEGAGCYVAYGRSGGDAPLCQATGGHRGRRIL